MPLLHPILKKSFQYEIEHRYSALRSDLHYISFPDNENVLHCIVSSGNFSRLDNALLPVDKIQECNHFLFENDKEGISKYCQHLILYQTRE